MRNHRLHTVFQFLFDNQTLFNKGFHLSPQLLPRDQNSNNWIEQSSPLIILITDRSRNFRFLNSRKDSCKKFIIIQIIIHQNLKNFSNHKTSKRFEILKVLNMPFYLEFYRKNHWTLLKLSSDERRWKRRDNYNGHGHGDGPNTKLRDHK